MDEINQIRHFASSLNVVAARAEGYEDMAAKAEMWLVKAVEEADEATVLRARVKELEDLLEMSSTLLRAADKKLARLRSASTRSIWSEAS